MHNNWTGGRASRWSLAASRARSRTRRSSMGAAQADGSGHFLAIIEEEEQDLLNNNNNKTQQMAEMAASVAKLPATCFDEKPKRAAKMQRPPRTARPNSGLGRAHFPMPISVGREAAAAKVPSQLVPRSARLNCERRKLKPRAQNWSLILCILFTSLYSILSLLLLANIWAPVLVSASSKPAQGFEQSRQHLLERRSARNSPSFLANIMSQPLRAQSFGGQGARHKHQQQLQESQQKQQNGLLVCPDGWHQFSGQCYKFFHQRRSWQRARDTCERHGGQLALIYDYQQNNFSSQLAQAALSSAGPAQVAAGSTNLHQLELAGQQPHAHHSQQQHQQALYASEERSYWIGYKTIDQLETNTLESAANTFVSKYVGFWDLDEPRVFAGECVRATIRRESSQSPGAGYRLVAQPSGECSSPSFGPRVG